MSKVNFLIFTILLSLFLYGCDNEKYTRVKFGDVSVELPSDWDISKTNNNSHYIITGQYHSRVESKILLVNVFDNQIIEAHNLAPKIKERLQKLSVHSPVKFYPIKISDFRGIKVHEMEYCGDEYNGRIIIYNDNVNTYFLMCQGKQTFLDSEITKHFLNSFSTYYK